MFVWIEDDDDEDDDLLEAGPRLRAGLSEVGCAGSPISELVAAGPAEPRFEEPRFSSPLLYSLCNLRI